LTDLCPMRKKIQIRSHSVSDLKDYYNSIYGDVEVRGTDVGPYGVSGCVAKIDGLTIEWITTTGAFQLFNRKGVDSIIIHFALCGHLRISSSDGCFEADPGTVLAVRNPTKVSFADGNRCNVVSIPVAMLQRRLSVLLDRPIERPVVFSNKPHDDTRLLTLLGDYISDLKQSPLLSVAGVMKGRHESISNAIVDSFLLCYPNNFSEAFAAPVPKIAPHHVKRAVDFIHSNPCQHVTPAFLADLSSVSVRSLQYSFISVTGYTISDYQRLLRLRHARDMVVNRTDMHLKEIAETCGFGSLAAFGQSFKSAYGVTPSQFRKMHASSHLASAGQNVAILGIQHDDDRSQIPLQETLSSQQEQATGRANRPMRKGNSK
jgi:AraC-like DNA-binding protein